MRAVKKRYYILGGCVVAIAAVVAVWDWDWFIPIAEAQASSALGRKVTITHLRLHIGWRPIVEVDGVAIANPDGFPADPPFAKVERLQVQLDVPAYIHTRGIVVPLIAVDKPDVQARQQENGANNWTFKLASSANSNAPSSSPPVKIGDLRITDGAARVIAPPMKADFSLKIATRQEAGKLAQLLVDATGKYAGQPIDGHFIGGALLSLRDDKHPYPIDLHVQNGPTKVALVGTVQDPLAFAGADLKLQFEGPDLALLYPLTGVPIPQTPSYELSGHLDYTENRIKFDHFAGRVGSSDLEGEIDVAPGAQRRMVTAKLESRKVDLTDLGGFIGATPGRKGTPDQTPAQKAAIAHAEASSTLIPNTPINLPKLRAADVDLHYRGAHILGNSIPLDNLLVDMSIKDGNIDLHPVSFGVGTGTIVGNIKLDGEEKAVKAHADIDFRKVPLSRLMASLHSFTGDGTIGGEAKIDTTGDSLATMLGNGDGGLKLFISGGGDISALLVDISGLEFGNALLSALGIPNKAQLQCFVGDFILQEGILETETLLLETSEAQIMGSGDVDLRKQTVDYSLKTQSRNFSIGSLPAPILISGNLKSPSIRPDAETLGIRAGAAVGLGVLATPLAALLPTIQLGLGDQNNCTPLLHTAEQTPRSPSPRRTR